MAWVVGGHFDDQWQIGVGAFDLGAQTARLLHPYEPIGMGGWPPAPAWSPDGQWLAFHAIAGDPTERGLWIARVDGEKEHFLGPGEGPVWSPDGRWLAFIRTTPGAESAIWLAEARTWRLQQVDLPPGAQAVVLAEGAGAVDWPVGWLDGETPILERLDAEGHLGLRVAGGSPEPGDLLPGPTRTPWPSRTPTPSPTPSVLTAPHPTDLDVARFVFDHHTPPLGTLTQQFRQELAAGEYDDFTRQDVDVDGDGQPEILFSGSVHDLYLYVAVLGRAGDTWQERLYTDGYGKYCADVHAVVEADRVVADFLTCTGVAPATNGTRYAVAVLIEHPADPSVAVEIGLGLLESVKP